MLTFLALELVLEHEICSESSRLSNASFFPKKASPSSVSEKIFEVFAHMLFRFPLFTIGSTSTLLETFGVERWMLMSSWLILRLCLENLPLRFSLEPILLFWLLLFKLSMNWFPLSLEFWCYRRGICFGLDPVIPAICGPSGFFWGAINGLWKIKEFKPRPLNSEFPLLFRILVRFAGNFPWAVNFYWLSIRSSIRTLSAGLFVRMKSL